MEQGPQPIVADLAPGDRRAADFDWSSLTVRRVTGATDPDFAAAYALLWDEFGARGEMERDAVIADRLAWDPRRPHGDLALLYHLLVVRDAERVVAVRDHTAIVRLSSGGPTVVHLSHALVAPSHRGTGLAGWLRTFPLQTARACAVAVGRPAEHPIVLVAEMEPPDPLDLACTVRLRAYERAGFRMVDPALASYAQPDFRPAAVLGDAPPAAVPLVLVVRRVGREEEASMPGEEVAAAVDALYGMYEIHLAPQAVAPLRSAAATWTRRQRAFALLPPTG